MNRFHPTPLVAALAMAGLAQAGAPAPTQLPTGGSVVAGTASIGSTTGAGSASMTITQSSQRAVVDWTRFDVGSAAQVSFVQPSASSVTLNRVLSSDPSQIFGRISANGQVFLTNPSGVYFAPSSSVDVGGLVATTHSIGNDAFMAGSNSFSRKGATGTVQNDGTLNAALGGYIALLAPTVRNQGVVVAKLGTVAMAAGDTFNLQIEGGRTLTGLEVTASTIASLVDNGLAVQAPGGLIILSAQALDRVQGGVVNNTGVLQANGLVNDGGRILLRASNKITHSGSITADAASSSAGKGGTVTLIADLANLSSRTEVNGSISAKGGAAGGDGGFIETSASKVGFGDNMAISTLAAPGLGGQNGTWLIDPTDFTIASSGGDMTGTALGTSLASGNVTIYSTSGASGSDGDINVNEAISWSANTLTLNAQADINVNAAMTGSGTAKLAFQYGQSAVSSGNASTYNISAAVSLPSGSNFSTQLGTDGTVTSYTVITSLGSAGDQSLLSATNSLQGLGYSTRLSGNYVLGADIAASGTSTWNSNSGFSPIGASAAATFTGVFDGLGHTVTGLTISRSTTFYVGLFGYMGSAGVVKNVGLLSNSVTGLQSVGGLAGRSDGTISNSYATGSVSGSQRVGGLVGRSDGTISSSYATGTVTASTTSVGGLAGSMATGTISSSYATATVTGPNAGGLVGVQDSGAITSSYATGAVTGNLSGAYYTGGLVGKGGATTASTITSSYATGAVSATGNFTGGLVGGFAVGGSVSTSYATGAVTGTGTHSGGLVGAFVLGAGTISNSYATGAVSGGNYRGGLLGGTAAGAYAISNTYATGVVSSSGATYSGGLVGYLLSSSSGGVSSSFWNSDNTASAGYGSAGTGLGSTAMKTASNFSAWSISSSGGSSSTWRIYDGSTSPLLRTFLTSLAVSDVSSTYTGSVQYGIGYGLSNISGTVASGTNAGSYTSTLYSNQQGYDLSGSGTLTIAKKSLTVSGTTAAGKTYDGSTSATITVGTLSGFVGGETVSATAIGSFDSRDAGVRSATASYTLTNGTGLASNYQLADTTGHSATIEKTAVEYPDEGDDNKYSTGWVRFQNQESAPLPWPQIIKAAVPAVEIRSPGIRLPDTAFQTDLPALAAVNTP